MSERKETLSALMDGEVNEFELRRLLKLDHDKQESDECWNRYHVISAIMKREPVTSYDLSHGVMQALEEAVETPESEKSNSTQESTSSPFSGMLRSFVSMGVAASVTAVVILGPNWLAQEDSAIAPPSSSVSVADTFQTNQFAQPVTFGDRSFSNNFQQSFTSENDMIRSPQGTQRYIDQHMSMVEPQPLQWGLAWLPDGYQNIRHQSTQAGEVMVFSNGFKAFSVSVEQLGMQTMPEGVIDAGNFIALGQAADDRFVTVVGDMPIMVAERIAAAVTQNQQ